MSIEETKNEEQLIVSQSEPQSIDSSNMNQPNNSIFSNFYSPKREFESIVLNNRNYNYRISNYNLFIDSKYGKYSYLSEMCGYSKKEKIIVNESNCNFKNIMSNISKMVNKQGHDCVKRLQSIQYSSNGKATLYQLPYKLFKIELENTKNTILVDYDDKEYIFSIYHFSDDNISDFIDAMQNIESNELYIYNKKILNN